MTAIDISNLCFSYDNGLEVHPIFNESHITVEDSRIIGLVGVNGCGKSTLLKIINGELKTLRGVISLCEKPLHELSNISFITQQAIDNVFPKLTVFENYMHFHEKRMYSLRRFDKENNRQACKEAIRAAGMNLEDRLDEQVRFLSGGQQQALGIMLACDMDSPILLMDEPTASLDVFVAEKILEIATNEIFKKNGLLIFTSPNLHDILKYTENIIVLNRGGEMKSMPNQDKNIDVNQLRNMMAQ